MKLTFWNGLDTVGGVQALATGDLGSLVFDLGVVRNPAIAPRVALFNDFVQPRPHNALADYLRAGMAPPLEGLFAVASAADGSEQGVIDPVELHRPLTADLPLVRVHERGTLAVYISHLHDDHMLLLPHVAPDVPIFMEERSAELLAALVAAGELEAVEAPVHGVPPGESFTIGDIECEVIPIDHDVIGASGVIIRGSDATVAYTGDWRNHGSAPSLVEHFADRCRRVGVDVLLTEGSTLGPGQERPQITEPHLVEGLDRLVGGCGGMVAVGFYPRNIERVGAIADIAAAHGRRFLVRPRTAAILYECARMGLIELDIDKRACVLAGTESVLDVPAVSLEDVGRNRDAFVCEMQPDAWSLLLDLAVGPGDVYIHANGAPFGTSDPGWRVLETWMEQLGMPFEVLDSHGHALPHDLEWFVDRVGAGTVVPVHSNDPGRFPTGNHRLVLPERGRRIEFSNG